LTAIFFFPKMINDLPIAELINSKILSLPDYNLTIICA
jgi:hypothetical protein